jgi:hypothetical protein
MKVFDFAGTLKAKALAKAASLSRQQNDFTAEGSPPPGMVASQAPAKPSRASPSVPRLRLAVPGEPDTLPLDKRR